METGFKGTRYGWVLIRNTGRNNDAVKRGTISGGSQKSRVYKLTMEFDYVSAHTFKVEYGWEIDGNDVCIIRNTSCLQC